MKSSLSKQFALTALTLVCSLGVAAKTVYVATDGDNSNDGSEGAPFATFFRANQDLVAGDTLVIGGGEYRQTMTITASGTDVAPILVRAKDGENVVIKGTEKVTGWTQHSGNIYSASVNMGIVDHSRQIYHNDEFMQIARWPNDVDNDIFTIDAVELMVAGTASSMNVEDMPDVDLSGGYVWYLGQHGGNSWAKEIISNTTTEITYPEIDIARWPYSNHNPSRRIDGGFGRYYVYGKLALLDHEREWFYDAESQTVYFQPADGNVPDDTAVEYAVRERAIEIDGSYVDVEGIDVWGANVKIDGDNNRYAGANVTHGKQRLNNTAPDAGASINDGSIYVIGRHNVIEDNVILHGSINGIQIAGWSDRGDFTVIQNNEIRFFDTVGIHASLIRSSGDNVRILKNTISHIGRDAVYVSGYNNEVAYNDVSFAAMINNDGGLFYTVGNANDRNTVVHHNWFHDAMLREYHGDQQKTAGIYLDNDSKGFLVHHNVVWNVPWAGLQLNWDNWNNHMYHNTLIDVGEAMGEWINGRNPRDNRVWNNFSSHPDWIRSDAYDLDSNLISPLNQFVDADNQNFMPSATSLLLDGGRIIDDVENFILPIDGVAAYSKPFVGPTPDIGAYEAGGTQWTAGVNAIEDTCDTCSSDPDSAPVHPPVEASASFDDRSKYLDTTYSAGDLEVSINYDAGTGNTVSDVLGGVRFLLRLIDSSTGSWVTVSDVAVDDASAIGQRAGIASASIPLAGLQATADLPEDHFYFLFVQFESSTGVKTAVNLQPIQIGEDISVPSSIELLDRASFDIPFSTADSLTMTINYEAGTGNTIQIRNNFLLGVRFHLREMTADFKVVGAPNSLFFNDETAIGSQTGQATATFSLAGLTPTADLPEGHFYQLGAVFKSTGDAGNNSVTLRVNIVAAAVEGDLDGDGVLGEEDTTMFLASLGSSQGDENFNAAADMDNDGSVTRNDYRLFAIAFRNQ